MPFSLHEMAMEYRMEARLAPSCEPKNREFLLESDTYRFILSMRLLSRLVSPLLKMSHMALYSLRA